VQSTICDFLIDITQNSIEAGSSVITIDVLEENNIITFCIGDNGKGMDEETLTRVKDPFFTDGIKHKKRKVGLGIPFLMQTIESLNCEFDIKSEVDYGTSLYYSFDMNNIDCPPLGDLPGSFCSLMLFEGDYELSIYRKRNNNSYKISRNELRDVLGSLVDAESIILAKKYIISQEEDLY